MHIVDYLHFVCICNVIDAAYSSYYFLDLIFEILMLTLSAPQ